MGEQQGNGLSEFGKFNVRSIDVQVTYRNMNIDLLIGIWPLY